MVDELFFWRRDGVLYKLDIKKVNDLVNWEFIDYMLASMALELNGVSGSIRALLEHHSWS